MNNINIKNIFSNNNILTQKNNISNLNGISLDNSFSPNNSFPTNFSVETIVESNTFKKSISDDYVVDRIKFLKQNEIAKTNDIYEIKYKECLIKINNSIEIGLTDIIFGVEFAYFGYKKFDSIECLKYIQKKLNSKNFLTMIISNNEIFISWMNLS